MCVPFGDSRESACCVVYCISTATFCIVGKLQMFLILPFSFHSNGDTINAELISNDILERSIDLRKHITRPDLEGSQVAVSLRARNSIGASEFSNTVQYNVPSSTTGTLAVCKAVFK